MNTDTLLSTLIDPKLWLLLGVTFSLGAVGALLHRTAQDPPPPGGGQARDALIGAVAAVAILYVTNPTSGVALIGGSLIAGYAGKLVLAGLEARVTTSLALREAAKRDLDAKQARRDLDQLAARVASMSPDPLIAAAGNGAVADVQRFARDLQTKQLAG